MIGVPVALFSVPSAADASGVAVRGGRSCRLLAFDDELSSPPHAATRSAARRDCGEDAHPVPGDLHVSPHSVGGQAVADGGFAEVAGTQQVAPAAQVLRRRLRARAVRGSARRRGRRPRARARRAARRTAPPRAEVLGHAAQDRQQALDDHGREPEAHLVDEQHARGATPARARRRASAARRPRARPALRSRHLLQLGQELEQLRRAACCPWSRPAAGARATVMPKNSDRPSGTSDDAAARELVRRHAGRCPRRRARRCRAMHGSRPGDRRQRRGLAGAVGPEQRDDLARRRRGGEVAHDGRAVVAGVERPRRRSSSGMRLLAVAAEVGGDARPRRCGSAPACRAR